jgi:predicted DCC family thiol-disulfide oxidoreductase YuxK
MAQDLAQKALGTAIGLHLLKDGRVHFASTAALGLLRARRPPWSMLWLARVVPGPLRGAVYFFIARNRIRVFGRTESCYLPDTEPRSRSLEAATQRETT